MSTSNLRECPACGKDAHHTRFRDEDGVEHRGYNVRCSSEHCAFHNLNIIPKAWNALPRLSDLEAMRKELGQAWESRDLQHGFAEHWEAKYRSQQALVGEAREIIADIVKEDWNVVRVGEAHKRAKVWLFKTTPKEDRSNG